MSALRKFPIVIAVAALASAATGTANGGEAVQRARAYVAALDKSDAPGCALGVLNLNSREWLYQGAFGGADLEKGIRNSPEMVFGVASVTKQFTAAATAIAAHQGHFALDDDIRKYVPEIPEYGAPITIRDLVHHINGLRDIGRLLDLTGKSGGYSSLASRIALLARQRAVNFPAGTEYRYGNSDYMLLSEIITRTTGRPFNDFVREQILLPLGMQDSGFGANVSTRRPTSVAYSYIQGKWRRNPGLQESASWGQGGFRTTLDDFGRWASNLMASESKLAGGGALTRMLREPGRLRDGTALSYGFGLRLEEYRGLKTVGHSGSGGGYQALTLNFPQRSLGVYGFCNNGQYAHPVVMGLADIFLELTPGAAPTQSPVVELPRAELERLQGTYREPVLRLPMVVEARDNALWIRGDGQPYIFEPFAAHSFRNKEHVIIEFSGDQGGRARYLEQKEGRDYGSGRYERIDVQSLTPAALKEFAGDYYSSDLDAVYRFSVKDGQLQARIVDEEPDGISPMTFEPMLRDEFVSIPNRMAVKFTRSAGDAPDSLVLTYQFGWITDVAFSRVRP